MTSPTFPNRTRFIVFFISMAIVAGIFMFFTPQFTSLDPEKAAIQNAQFELNKERYRQAAELLIDAATKYPRNAEIRYYLGVAYQGLNQDKIALDQYLAALTLNPYQIGAVFEVGKAYILSGQIRFAEDMLSRLQASCNAGQGCAERDYLAGLITQSKASVESRPKPNKNKSNP